jgi:hypothetical protein
MTEILTKGGHHHEAVKARVIIRTAFQHDKGKPWVYEAVRQMIAVSLDAARGPSPVLVQDSPICPRGYAHRYPIGAQRTAR